MDKAHSTLDQRVLDEQTHHWEKSFSRRADMFGADASEAAQKAAELFKKNGVKKLLKWAALSSCIFLVKIKRDIWPKAMKSLQSINLKKADCLENYSK